MKAAGQMRDDRAILRLDVAAGGPVTTFDVVLDDSDIYVRPRGSTRQWYLGRTLFANWRLLGVRLDLVRDAVLLAPKVSKGTVFANGGFSSEYTVTPAAEQQLQIQGFVLNPADEARFLKSSSVSLVLHVSTRGDQLQQVDNHLDGVDLSTSTRQKIDSILTFSHVGGIAPIPIPTGALAVPASQLFSTSQTAGG